MSEQLSGYVDAEMAVAITPPQYLGSRLIAITCQHPETGQLVVAAGTPHIPEATVETPEIRAAIRVCEEFMQQTEGDTRGRLVINEGRTPKVIHDGVQYPGDMDLGLDTANFAEAASIYGEVGVLVCLARLNGCEVIGEKDLPIIRELEQQVDPADLYKYLTWRQITNYYLKAPDNRPTLEAYLRTQVIERYRKMLGDTFGLTIDDAISDVHQSLADGGISLADDEAIMKHFLGQSVIDGAVKQIEEGTDLTRVQQVAVRYNWLRDVRLTSLLLDDWGKSTAPHKLAVFGPTHLNAIVVALHNKGIIRQEAYEYYAKTARSLGRRVLRWTDDGGLRIEANR